MSIVVEDGTGLSTANAYVAVAAADAYFIDRGNTVWENADDDDKTTALIRATQALDAMFASRWPGYACSLEQALEWPRYDALNTNGYELDSDSVPQAVKNACCEAALIELTESGALSKALARGGAVQSEKVGSILTSYFAGAPAGTVYTILKQALSKIIPFGSHRTRRG